MPQILLLAGALQSGIEHLLGTFFGKLLTVSELFLKVPVVPFLKGMFNNLFLFGVP